MKDSFDKVADILIITALWTFIIIFPTFMFGLMVNFILLFIWPTLQKTFF